MFQQKCFVLDNLVRLRSINMPKSENAVLSHFAVKLLKCFIYFKPKHILTGVWFNVWTSVGRANQVLYSARRHHFEFTFHDAWSWTTSNPNEQRSWKRQSVYQTCLVVFKLSWCKKGISRENLRPVFVFYHVRTMQSTALFLSYKHKLTRFRKTCASCIPVRLNYTAWWAAK